MNRKELEGRALGKRQKVKKLSIMTKEKELKVVEGSKREVRRKYKKEQQRWIM